MKKTVLALGALAVVAVSLFAANGMESVSAYRGDYTKVGPNHTEEREDAMEKAMKAKDFAAWKKLMTENGRTPGVLRVVDTQEEFNKFADAYALGKAGKTAEAEKLRSELGLGQGGGQGKGAGRGQNRSGNFVGANSN